MKHLLLLLLLVAALACALPVAAAGSSQGNNTITALGVAADPADSTRPVPLVERAPAGAVTSGPATTPTVEPAAPSDTGKPAPPYTGGGGLGAGNGWWPIDPVGPCGDSGCGVTPRFLGPPIPKP